VAAILFFESLDVLRKRDDSDNAPVPRAASPTQVGAVECDARPLPKRSTDSDQRDADQLD
jgi:hypothetical protein